MFRKLTPLIALAILLGAVSAPALAETRSHHAMQPHRHDRVSPYAGGFRNYPRAGAPEDFLVKEECEFRGLPDCH
jgi:hypothetical protein